MALMNWFSPIARNLFLLIPLFQCAPAVESLWLLDQLPIMDQPVYRTETFQENATKQFIILDASAESFDGCNRDGGHFGISCAMLSCWDPLFAFHLILELKWKCMGMFAADVVNQQDRQATIFVFPTKTWGSNEVSLNLKGVGGGGGLVEASSSAETVHFHRRTCQKQQQVQLPHCFCQREDTTFLPQMILMRHMWVTPYKQLAPLFEDVSFNKMSEHEISYYACA